MSASTYASPEASVTSVKSNPLPINSIVRALCQAANSGPDLLYEVMLKVSLVVEATAPMYGLSIWHIEAGQRPRLEWAEGLQEGELLAVEAVVCDTLAATDSSWPSIKAGDISVCLVLASTKQDRPGAALYAQGVRP